MQQRQFEVLNGVVSYEPVNLRESVLYSLPRSLVLINKTVAEVEDMFLKVVEKQFDDAVDQNDSNYFGRQHQVYNAFYFMEKPPSMLGKKIGYALNFFVRPGREILNA